MTPAELTDEETYRRIGESAAWMPALADVVTVDGPDAGSWLQGQVTQDLVPVATGSGTEALVLSPQGKVESHCSVVRVAEDTWLLVTRAGYGEALEQRLRRFKLRVKADLSLASYATALVRGPESARLAAEITKHRPVVTAVATSWPQFEGTDLLFEPGPSHEDPGEAGLPDAFEARRIEAGVPLIGNEITERTIPQEAGALVSHAVSFTKGCYTGQELVARIDARGNNVPRRLRFVRTAAARASEDAAVPGEEIVLDGSVVGELTSVAWSPGAGRQVALAYVKRGVAVPSEAVIGRSGATPVEILPLPGAP